MSNVVPINLNQQEAAKVLEKVVVEGDLSRLSPAERLFYYQKVCESVGLNPLTRPFEYIFLNGRLVLYAKKDATDQLRKIHGISVSITSREKVGDVYVVTAKARDKEGREDEAIGAVPLQKREVVWDQKKQKYVPTGKMIPLTAEELANAIMRAETKSKRRVTLSIAGLGMLDETELETIPEENIRHFQEDVPAATILEMKPAEEKQEKPAAPENPAQQEQPAEKTANPVSGVDTGVHIREFTLQDMKPGKSESQGDYVAIYTKEADYPIYAVGKSLSEAAKIEGGVGSKVTLEIYKAGKNVLLRRVIDGGFSPAQPETAADGTGKNDKTPSISEPVAQADEKRFVLGEFKEGKTGSDMPYVKFFATDTSTGEKIEVIAGGAGGADKVELFRTIPRNGTFGMKLKKVQGVLFLEEVIL